MMPKSLDDEICAGVTAVTYRPRTKTGYLRLKHYHVPDMSGSIKVFTRLDPSVERILVYDGKHLNTAYSRASGSWKCVFLDNPIKGTAL
jgi:hypothetical protein